MNQQAERQLNVEILKSIDTFNIPGINDILRLFVNEESFCVYGVCQNRTTLAHCNANLQQTNVKILLSDPDLYSGVRINKISACHTVIVHHPKSKRYWYMHVSPSALHTREDLIGMHYAALSPELYSNHKPLMEFCAISDEDEEVDILVIDTNSSKTKCQIEELMQQIPCKIRHCKIITQPEEIIAKSVEHSRLCLGKMNGEIAAKKEKADFQRESKYSIWCFPEIDTLGFVGVNSSGEECFYVMRDVFHAIATEKELTAEKMDISGITEKKEIANTFFQNCFNISPGPKNN